MGFRSALRARIEDHPMKYWAVSVVLSILSIYPVILLYLTGFHGVSWILSSLGLSSLIWIGIAALVLAPAPLAILTFAMLAVKEGYGFSGFIMWLIGLISPLSILIASYVALDSGSSGPAPGAGIGAFLFGYIIVLVSAAVLGTLSILLEYLHKK